MDILALASSLARLLNPEVITKSLGCDFFFLRVPRLLGRGGWTPPASCRGFTPEPETHRGRVSVVARPHGAVGDGLAVVCGGLSVASIMPFCSAAPSRNAQYLARGFVSAVQLGTLPLGTLGVFKMISQIFLIFFFNWPWANFWLSLMHKVGLKKCCCFSLSPHLNISGMSSLVSLGVAGEKKKKSLEELGDVFFLCDLKTLREGTGGRERAGR